MTRICTSVTGQSRINLIPQSKLKRVFGKGGQTAICRLSSFHSIALADTGKLLRATFERG